MKVIVDAYNVLHQVMKGEHVSEHERKHFINLLSVYAKRKGHDVIAVFDGGPMPFATTEPRKNIIVKFSGVHDTADDIILRYIKEHQGHSMVLVSSDHELCAAAQYYDVQAVAADDFYALLIQKEKPKEKQPHVQTIKTTKGSPAQVDELLKRASHVQMKVEDMSCPIEDRSAPAKKRSKKERKRMAKIKKL